MSNVALLQSIRDQYGDVLYALKGSTTPESFDDPEVIKQRIYEWNNNRNCCEYEYAEDANFSRYDTLPIKVRYWPTLVLAANLLRRLDSYIAAASKELQRG
jgi:hypothetical protein